MRNSYKVSKRQWAKWGTNARNVFNALYGTMSRNQKTYNAHHETTVLARAHWRVVAWNAAFVAACSVSE